MVKKCGHSSTYRRIRYRIRMYIPYSVDHRYILRIWCSQIYNLEGVMCYCCIMKQLGTWLQSKRVMFHWDNLAVANICQHGVSKNNNIMQPVRTLLYVCATHNMECSAVHVSGIRNDIADALSRGQNFAYWFPMPKHTPPFQIDYLIIINDWYDICIYMPYIYIRYIINYFVFQTPSQRIRV